MKVIWAEGTSGPTRLPNWSRDSFLNKWRSFEIPKQSEIRSSLEVQWLPCSQFRGQGSIPVQGTRPCMPQPKGPVKQISK